MNQNLCNGHGNMIANIALLRTEAQNPLAQMQGPMVRFRYLLPVSLWTTANSNTMLPQLIGELYHSLAPLPL